MCTIYEEINANASRGDNRRVDWRVSRILSGRAARFTWRRVQPVSAARIITVSVIFAVMWVPLGCGRRQAAEQSFPQDSSMADEVDSEADSAIEAYTEAIRRDPQDARSYYDRGSAYENRGEHAKAQADFAKAKELWPTEDIRAMVQRLFSPQDDNSEYERLKFVGAKAAPFLREALSDPRVAKRFDKDGWQGPDYPLQLICGLLEPIDSEIVVQHLMAYAEHEDRGVRRCAARFLGEIGTSDCITPVLKLLDDDDDYVRSRAMDAILDGVKADRCDKQFLEAVFPATAKLLNRETSSVFGEAPKLLLAIDADRALPILVSNEYFTVENSELHHIIDSLNSAGHKIRHDKLLPLLEQVGPRSDEYPHSYQYATALKAYALNPDNSAEQTLRNALLSPNETVQEAAAEGLSILAGLTDPLSFVLDVLETEGFDRLSVPQKYYYAVYVYNAEVNNGGHSQYFVNSSGDLWKTALSGLEKIGAKERAGVLREAVNLFGGAGPAEDNDRRQRQISRFSDKQDETLEQLDSRYYSCQENVGALLHLYAIDNADEFRE